MSNSNEHSSQNTIELTNTEKIFIEEKRQKLTRSRSDFPGLYFELVASLCTTPALALNNNSMAYKLLDLRPTGLTI